MARAAINLGDSDARLLVTDLLQKMDAYWGAINLWVGQIYLYDNPMQSC